MLLLTYLTLELYLAGHYGGRGGEFRFSLDVPALPDPRDPSQTLGPFRAQPPVLDFGAALRMSL